MDCIFCDIANKEKDASIVYEDNNFISFKNINPKAPVHILLIPKKHIVSINDLQDVDKEMMGEMFLVVKKIVKEQGIGKGYKLAFNVGRDGGQAIDHLHLHILGGF